MNREDVDGGPVAADLVTDDRDDPGSTSVEEPGRRSRIGLIGKVAAVAAIAGSFALWGYAFSGLAERPAPDLLDDPSFAVSAESTCAAALADLDELPNALDAADGAERADQIRASTARLERMVDELDGLVGGSARDVEITSGWLADWRVLLADRLRYADAIEVDDDAQFLITDPGVDERLDRRITRLAVTNSMRSCSVPSDVG